MAYPEYRSALLNAVPLNAVLLNAEGVS